MSYTKRRQRAFTSQTPKPWPWLFTGLLIGALVVFLPSLQNWLPWKEKDANNTPASQNATQAKEASAEPAPPRFEFYSLLPKMEVAVPEPKSPPSRQQPELQPQAPPEASSQPALTPSKSAPSEAYVLQAGSFRSYAQADKRKADLALMGVEASIQTVTIDNSKTWHRVRIGPSRNLTKLQRIRQQLRENHIECQLLKVKA